MQEGHGGVEAERQDQEEKAVEEEEDRSCSRWRSWCWCWWDFYDGYSLIGLEASVANYIIAFSVLCVPDLTEGGARIGKAQLPI